MKYIIKSAVIVDSKSEYNLKQKDLYIENGIISKIEDNIIEQGAELIEIDGLHLSPGFIDLNSNSGDPGYEHKENLNTLSNAAVKGGYTHVAIMPDTKPVIQTKADVEYIKSKSSTLPVHILVIGASTVDTDGKELSEMFDMYSAGAIAFSNGKHAFSHAGVMTKALMYVKQFGAKLFTYADDKQMSAGGYVHEGVVSTKLGLRSRPSISEELIVQRDIALTEFTKSSLHFSTLSTSKSIEMIKEAKAKQISVTCDVAAHHLLLTDESLTEFESVYKVLPPLRSEEHRLSLLRAFNEGSIDAICSDHTPQDVESKHKEFDLAEYGAIGLQTAFAVANTALNGKVSLNKITDAFTHGPRKVLGMNEHIIKSGSEANLTLFNPNLRKVFLESEIVSKSKNSMFIGKEMLGVIFGTLCKGKYHN
jgi:dihydroorotase